MELAREARDEIVTAALGAAAAGAAEAGPADERHPAHLDSETATLMLRRCTALAARARVDLLSPSRGVAAEELIALLAQLERWEPAALETPDPIITVLAAAALQDLAERLRLADLAPASDTFTLATSTDAVLVMLQGLMENPRVDVSA